MKLPAPRPVSARSTFAGWLPCALAGIAVAGCGREPAAQPAASGDAAAGPTLDAPQDLQRPPAPARVFASRYAPLGPWYAELAAKVDPLAPSDPWRTEAMADLFRRLLLSGLQAAQGSGTSRFGELCTADTLLATRLRPLAADSLSGGSLDVRTGSLEAEASRGVEPVLAALRELTAPHRAGSAPRFDAWITAAWSPTPETFELLGSLRLASDRGPGSLQTNLALEARLRVQGQHIRLERLAARDFIEVESGRRTYEELTAHVLSDAAWLDDGATQRTGRTDRLVIYTDVYLGMHGLGVGDVDGDGLEDVYVARQGGLPNLLLRHLPDGRARDVAAEAGVDLLDDTGGVLIVDLDGDGARDLALGVADEVAVLWNDGEGHFPSSVRLQGGSRDRVYSLSAGDADGDGDLDLYDTRYFSGEYGGGAPTPYHDAHNGARNSFWRNDGRRGFQDATDEVGLGEGNDRFSLTSLWEDFDDDGDLDLYVVNDFGSNNLYANEGGRFRDVAGELGLGDMAAGMGISSADVDLDGRTDLYVSNMFSAPGARVTAHPKFMPHASPDVLRAYQRHTRGNSLLAREASGRWVDVTDAAAVAPGGWAWGAIFGDLENDGLADVFVPSGFTTNRDPRDLASFFWRVVVNASPPEPPSSEAYLNTWRTITRLAQAEGLSWSGHERNYAYKNLGGRRFADVSAAVGLDTEDDARSAVRVDWDGDGREDLWVKNRTAPLVRFWRNVHPAAGSSLALELVGRPPNTGAVGARVQVRALGVRHVRTVHAGEGYLAGPSLRLHFGLGEATRVEELSVRWPDGSTTTHADLPASGLWRVRQDGGRPEPSARPTVSLDDVAGRTRPTVIGEPDSRVVALERLPYSGLPLARYDAAPASVRDHAGAPLLVVLFGSWDERAGEMLAALRSLPASGVAVHPLSLDGPRDEAYARSLARAAGLPESGGRADRRAHALLELALQAILPAYDDLPLPIGLLFDPRGALCVVYVGALDPARALADARLAALEVPADAGRLTTALTGGRWLRPAPSRPLRTAAEYLRRERGENELAAELEAFDARR